MIYRPSIDPELDLVRERVDATAPELLRGTVLDWLIAYARGL